MVDRRCVWRFCIADSASDLKLLSAKEQIAQKIMRKARAGLERSKRDRTGHTRMYEEKAVHGRPLVGGETFPRMLRDMTAEFSLVNETNKMSNIRLNEEIIEEHFNDLYLDIDVFRKRTGRSASAKKKNKSKELSNRNSNSGGNELSSDGFFLTTGLTSK